MSLNILVVPDKFKGTLTAQAAAQAIARGWKKYRPDDRLELLPMSDGGDGFGEVLSAALGAKPQKVRTVDAARRAITATWWWEPGSKTAIIEAAKVNGLAMLPAKTFHPFQLDTFGLGKVLRAVAIKGGRRCLIGIGGSATNDGGFGMARALGWKFLDSNGRSIEEWWQLHQLASVQPPGNKLALEITVAVDVQNPLLGPTGCSRIYGPQKGLREEDFGLAEKCLGKLAESIRRALKKDFATVPGAGAAGGLGFGLMAFAGAKPQPGFDIFAQNAGLQERLRTVDLVITGEGALDAQTLMGKGVGQVAALCKQLKVPCLGLAGMVEEKENAKKLFVDARGLTEITTLENAKKQPAKFLEELAAQVAKNWKFNQRLL